MLEFVNIKSVRFYISLFTNTMWNRGTNIILYHFWLSNALLVKNLKRTDVCSQHLNNAGNSVISVVISLLIAILIYSSYSSSYVFAKPKPNFSTIECHKARESATGQAADQYKCCYGEDISRCDQTLGLCGLHQESRWLFCMW